MIPYNCPRCGVENEDNSHFCKTCSYNTEFIFIENPACPQCYTSYPKGTHFCEYDGSKLISQNELHPQCSHCGKQYDPNTMYCPEDGTLLIKNVNQAFNNLQILKNSNGTIPRASSGNRFLAFLLDGLISLGLSIPAIIFFFLGLSKLNGYNREYALVFFCLAFLLYLLPLSYSLIKDGLGKGQSFGKKAVGLMVIDIEKNCPCSYGKSCFRNIIMTLVNMIPFVGWLIEPIMVLATEDGRRLGDKAANTQVIDVQK